MKFSCINKQILEKFYNKIHHFQSLRYCKLVILGSLSMPGHPCQHNSISLYETLMFTCIQKINLVHHFFLEMLHFKESCNLSSQDHFDTYLRTRLSIGKGLHMKHKWQCFILDYFQKKLKNFFFQKTHYFWPTVPIFWQNKIFL